MSWLCSKQTFRSVLRLAGRKFLILGCSNVYMYFLWTGCCGVFYQSRRSKALAVCKKTPTLTKHHHGILVQPAANTVDNYADCLPCNQHHGYPRKTTRYQLRTVFSDAVIWSKCITHRRHPARTIAYKTFSLARNEGD